LLPVTPKERKKKEHVSHALKLYWEMQLIFADVLSRMGSTCRLFSAYPPKLLKIRKNWNIYGGDYKECRPLGRNAL
jgi:hypothetical protein